VARAAVEVRTDDDWPAVVPTGTGCGTDRDGPWCQRWAGPVPAADWPRCRRGPAVMPAVSRPGVDGGLAAVRRRAGHGADGEPAAVPARRGASGGLAAEPAVGRPRCGGG
jgi:hypothetical protein